MRQIVWVLLRWAESRSPDGGGDDASVHSVHETREGLEARIDRVALANPQYEMRQLSDSFWRIGPDEDEGFFGSGPIYFRAVKTEVRP